jgi:hypothetical protein
MNPASGRAIERARAAQAISARQDSNHQEPSSHWVTIHGRHVLIKEAPKAARDKIAGIAGKYNGSTNWGFAKRKDNFPPNTDKCNKFVYDITKEGGAEPLVIGSDGKQRPPLAAEWADPNTKIANWKALGENEVPQPGDVAAYKLPGHTGYTGHSGIVISVDPDGTVHAIAAHANVVGPDDKFQQVPGVTFRRYTGDQ